MTSDRDTTVDDLKASAARFCDERDWGQFHNPKDLAIGIASEAGELLEIFRFKTSEEVGELMLGHRMEDVRDELADVLYFLLRFSQVTGIDLSAALEDKLAKNALRYPADKVRGDNRKYEEYLTHP